MMPCRCLRFLLFSIAGLLLLSKVNGRPEYYGRGQQDQQTLGDSSSQLQEQSNAVDQLLDALNVLDKEYFEIWQGVWPTSIDWTSAVIGTFLAASLNTLSSYFASTNFDRYKENSINRYFSQLTSSYFGQNAFAIRQEAYDDMLWVVLGWIEGIKFVEAHTVNHFNGTIWHGSQFIPAFAHRARIFWELAAKGWDTKFCNGGMLWSPYLIPYKNAITNELFISASISMYLYFPGDDNESPFSTEFVGGENDRTRVTGRRDPIFLEAALDGYQWLLESNMTNKDGLFVDGYHISGRSANQCDARNEMVYTYNQGVLLTGQRGLYEATGQRKFLTDGHQLISDVITVTGWDLDDNVVMPEASKGNQASFPQWRGLGRSGILEEVCDSGAQCSQDAQTFKGIFFHHFAVFCQDLPEPSASLDYPNKQMQDDRRWHTNMCRRYRSWVKHNSKAALRTRDGKGRFGMWWGAPYGSDQTPAAEEVLLPGNAVDYRNQGVPEQRQGKGLNKQASSRSQQISGRNDVGSQDLNDRGRGRTVETQGGGISIIRALQELL